MAAAALAVVAGAVGIVSPTSESHQRAPSAPPAAKVVAVHLVKRCLTPAPTSAEGYQAMFAALDPGEWGAADVSISVQLLDGRALWLYGDTFSTKRFVHSTAIVQDRGCLRVANGGAQLLPDDDATHIYWIHDAHLRSDGMVAIRARLVHLTGGGMWGFEDGGAWRTTIVQVDKTGNVHIVRQSELVAGPAPDPGPLYRIDDRPHHFGYSLQSHPWALLASGKTLTTMCQNWDDGVLHPWVDYRPIFSER